MNRILTGVSVLLVAGTSLFARNEMPPTAQESLLDTEEQIGIASAREGLDGIMKFFAEQATLLPGDGPMLRGKDAIRRYLARTFGEPGFRLEMVPDEIRTAHAADMGFTLGRFEAEWKAEDGSVKSRHGQYNSLWKRDTQKRWHIVSATAIISQESGGGDPCPDDEPFVYLISTQTHPAAHRNSRCVI